MAELMDKTKNIIQANHKKLLVGFGWLIILAALGVGFHVMYDMEGIVTAKNGQCITVADFLRTETVDLKGTGVDPAVIKIGDRVDIHKNIQGKVIWVRAEADHHEYDKHGHMDARYDHKDDQGERE